MSKRKRNRNKSSRSEAANTTLANRAYKDTIFRMIFSDPKNLLSLYNAVTKKNYRNPDDLEIVTLEECIRDGILSEFLTRNRAEVVNMSIFEYDKELEEKKLRKAEYEAGFSDGEKTGFAEGGKSAAIETAKRMIALHEFSVEKIAEISGLSLDEISGLCDQI